MPSDGPSFARFDASTLPPDLLELLTRTARNRGRIELTNCNGETCVVLSKEELDGLEEALDILANSDHGKALQHSVEQFAYLFAHGA
jgi:hypothetical protein